MPELPEVETIRRQLARLIVGKTISYIEVLNKGSFRADPDGLIGKTITGVGRKGKVLILRTLLALRQGESLSDDKRAIFIHLKMSGRLEFINRNISNPSKKARPFQKRPGLSIPKHLRVAIGFTDGSHLLFHDQRKFGWITDDPAVLPSGIDALNPKLTPKKLAEILTSSNRPVKTILLDQSKIAGIGNIYASEILWQAKTNPAIKGLTFCVWKGVSLPWQGDSLSETSGKFRKLLAAIREVLTEAIDSGGSTMDDQLYRHVSGQTGNYWSRRRVYDREGELCHRSACRKAGALIQKTVIGQRSTYWCTSCQSN